MRLLAAPWRVGERLAAVMLWLLCRALPLLVPLLERLWRRLRPVWRCVAGRVARLLGASLLAIRYLGRRDGGDRDLDRDEKRRENYVVAGAVEGVRCDEGRDEAELRRGAPREREEEEEEEEEECECEVEPTDEFYCDYDSTWESEEGSGPGPGPAFSVNRRSARSRSHQFTRFNNAARDMQNYRRGYPFQRPHWNQPAVDGKPNLSFYLGRTPSLPDGAYIGDFHTAWFGNYETLESVHTYIQWLFPLEEPGMNYEASTLTKVEIEDFLQEDTAKENLLKSYKLMLDFYGIELCDEATGEVRRARNWRDRFDNLNSHTHNNLRITRILKCLGVLGFREYQAPLVRFFLEETLVRGELPNVRESVLNYFVFAVLNRWQRKKLLKFAFLNYGSQHDFVWCPRKVQAMWSSGSSPCKPQK